MIKIILSLLSLTGVLLINSPVLAEELIISGNGPSSDNQINISSTSTQNIVQSNQAEVTNEVVVDANSGGNQTSGNSGGDTTINTGAIQSDTLVSNSVNSSVVDSQCCPDTGLTAQIVNNGAHSENKIDVSTKSLAEIEVNNKSSVDNHLDYKLNTGKNNASNNSGDTKIKTGNVKVLNAVKNEEINQSEVSLAQPTYTNLNLKIWGNAAGSTNNINFKFENLLGVTLNNQANIENIINIDSNTGYNLANANLGDVSILTGDISLNTVIKNGPINSNRVTISCCPDGKVNPPPSGGPNPTPGPSQPSPQPGAPSPTVTIHHVTQSVGQVLAAVTPTGDILPVSGNNLLLLMTIICSIMFLLGLYLRLHPGRDPAYLVIR